MTRIQRSGTTLLACVSLLLTGPAALAGEAVTGLVLDANTAEPIEYAWIFEAVPEATRGADVRTFGAVRIVSTNARGEFLFESARRSWVDSLLHPFRSTTPARYHFYHPSYGLLWGREAENGRVSFKPSLRDAHLRIADAEQFCVSGAKQDPLRNKVRSLACPPGRAARYADGSPRAQGEFDAQGRRTGRWTFFREDGSVIASGEYDAGAATGEWGFHPARD